MGLRLSASFPPATTSRHPQIATNAKREPGDGPVLSLSERSALGVVESSLMNSLPTSCLKAKPATASTGVKRSTSHGTPPPGVTARLPWSTRKQRQRDRVARTVGTKLGPPAGDTLNRNRAVGHHRLALWKLEQKQGRHAWERREVNILVTSSSRPQSCRWSVVVR